MSITQEFEINTATEVDPRYRELYTLYAMRLKPLVKKVYRKYFPLKYYPNLMETLAHNFNLNGTHYDTALTAVLQNWVPKDEPWTLNQKSELSLPCKIFKTIGLLRSNNEENPYIHAAVQILKSLEKQPIPISMAAAHYPIHPFTGMRRLWAQEYPSNHETQFMHQQHWNNINSGRIYRLSHRTVP